MNVSYKNMFKYFEQRKPFNGSTATAVLDVAGNYLVKHYDTTLVVVKPDGSTLLNGNHYSATTSKFQTMLKQYFVNAEIIEGDTEFWKVNVYKYDFGAWRRK